MRRLAYGAICGALLGVALAGCSGLFPKCDDPKHPCPNVQPEYPPQPSFGKARDAGADR